MSAPISFDNSYSRLPDAFFSRQSLQPVSDPALIQVNPDLAATLEIDADWLTSNTAIEAFSGNIALPGSDPIATVYAGFQFGNFNPQLGDGRALLLGEVVTKTQRYDIQLKGSGATAFSRGGDGRSPLGPVLREYLVSEAMAALGVPTTRSLVAIATGDSVQREGIEPGGILTRVAQSHIRFGTFQYFSARQDNHSLRQLADYVITRHFPQLSAQANPYEGLLETVIDNVAHLISHWQCLGFIHGVMNTDNMLITGETVDYGPCAFMDRFKYDTVYSAIDQGARYAFQNQPSIAHWNLMTFAQALLPLIDDQPDQAIAIAKARLDEFPDRFDTYWRSRSAAKLGLMPSKISAQLYSEFLQLLENHDLDFTLSFAALREAFSTPPTFGKDPAWHDWWTRWQEEIGATSSLEQAQARMTKANPTLIPRNHQIEFAIAEAYENGTYDRFSGLLAAVTDPFNPDLAKTAFALAPKPDEIVRRTFCGT